MNHGLMYVLGIATLGPLGIAVSPAEAQTTANGPYYATPSWDQTLPASTRFIVLPNMGSNAVLDRETGLVWEKSPTTSTLAWLNAQLHCNALTTGARLGWRLPTVQELASLVDTSVALPGPTLPSGHPFTNVQSSDYWSATAFAGDPSFAWVVSFFVGDVGHGDKNSFHFFWCVRGGQGVDAQ